MASNAAGSRTYLPSYSDQVALPSLAPTLVCSRKPRHESKQTHVSRAAQVRPDDSSATSRLNDHVRPASRCSSPKPCQCGSRPCDLHAPEAVSIAAKLVSCGEPRKQTRFLCTEDRCKIIRRLAAGEKQADLAREFKVTRAAISYMKKNLVQILARSTSRDVNHPKQVRYKTISKPLITQLDCQGTRSHLPIVYEVRSSPMMTLLSALRDKETRLSQFRHYADRAIRLLLEEALACAETQTIQLVTPSDCLCEEVQVRQTSCGVALGEGAHPMLEVFCALNPDGPAGYLPQHPENPPHTTTTRSDVQLPLPMDRHAVFLMTPTCPTGLDMCAAVQTLLDHGAQPSSIFFVCLVLSNFAASEICQRCPAVRIITAAIDPHVTSISICPGIGDFRSRYSAVGTGVATSPSDYSMLRS